MNKVLIVEDDVVIADGLTFDLEGLGFTVLGVAREAEELYSYLEQEFPDVVIMDIELKGDKDGIQLAKEINDIQPVGIVYLSSKDDDRVFNRIERQYKAIFLSKPIPSPRQLSINVQMAYDDVLKRRKFQLLQKEKKSLFVHTVEGKKVNLNKDRIQYLKADGSYSDIYLADGSLFKVSKNMKTVHASLPNNFIQVHKSFVINIDEIEVVEDKELVMKETKTVIKTSRTYWDNFKNRTTFL